MKKTILSIFFALSAASPVLAASVVPPVQQPEQQQQQNPGIKDIKLLSIMTMNPVFQAYKKVCIDDGGNWVRGDGNILSWACRNSAGKFGIDGLPPGQHGVPLTFLVVTKADVVTKTLQYSVYLDDRQVNVTAVLVKPGTNNGAN
jgi:hypothetical protein